MCLWMRRDLSPSVEQTNQNEASLRSVSLCISGQRLSFLFVRTVFLCSEFYLWCNFRVVYLENICWTWNFVQRCLWNSTPTKIRLKRDFCWIPRTLIANLPFSDMCSSNDMNTAELCDDVDNLLFLCDRLHTSLSQVTSHVDEVRQTWTQKRQAIESDPNLSPIIAQKAARCNKILLYVAEKLAVVELQTESLRSLQVPMTHLNASTPLKREGNCLRHSCSFRRSDLWCF